MKISHPIHKYNILTQLDYLAGLATAFMLGAERWDLFFLLLGVSLTLGCLTVRAWGQTMVSFTDKTSKRKGGS